MIYSAGAKVIYSRSKRSADGGWWQDIPCTVLYCTGKRIAIKPDTGGRALYVKWYSLRPSQPQDREHADKG